MQIAEPRMAPADAVRGAGICLAIVVTVAAGALGGMPILLMVLALALAVRVYRQPQRVIVCGPLFLLVANVFLPSSARFTGVTESWQIYYWAIGVFVITCAALLSGDRKAFFTLPRSLLMFLFVALVASAYGFARGNETSYVIRQLFGALLFVAYFSFASQVKDDEPFFRTLRVYGTACAFAYFAYYAWMFSEYGLHREMGTLGTQGSMLGILFAAHKGWRWRLASGCMFLLPVLVVERRALAVFALGVILIGALTLKARSLRTGAWILSAVIVIVSLVPTYVELILDTATNTKLFDDLLPQGGRDSSSIEDRSMQLLGSAIVVNRSPVLGLGMGGRLEFESVMAGTMEEAYVDNGWAYILTKMGIAGLLAFIWFAVVLIKWMPGNSVPLSACVLAMLLLGMFAEPVFLQFSTSPFLGAMAGLLYARRPLSAKQR